MVPTPAADAIPDQDDVRPEDVARLSEQLVRELRELKAIVTPEVERAVRAVPRHLFVPEVPLEKAYAAEHHYVTKKDEHGVSISSVSAARVQAMMLEQAGVRPGMRVLEIGSSGYNAALLAELVGKDGEVVSIDIDPDVLDRARQLLPAAGYDEVILLRADGEFGAPQYAPFDRIIVTAGAWDIPPAWVDQLAPGGRIVVPLRMRGLTRSIAFDLDGDRLVARDYQLCGFVPMQGVGENRTSLVLLHGAEGEEVGLRLDEGQQVNAPALARALHQPRVERWSGVTVGGFEPFDNLDLWLATVLDGFVLLTAKPQARERGLVASVSPLGVATLADDDSFAYRTVRPTSEERTLFEFGVYGHGPNADALADRLAEQIRLWDRDYRQDQARIEAHPLGTPAEELPAGRLIDKRHRRITISWP
ncbi:methyltransferase, FxLD system [Frankia sp. R82]|uniref:methyltransferase, FxLD system n=1 Tax=Frankia sp. R82 TaxID=2950553 RepID=UPI0035ABCE1A